MPLPATILVVEDEQDQMTLLTQVLTRAGYHVVPAYGGEDAIRKVKTRKIDLVVTDLAMPKMTGIELTCMIKTDPATRHIPVIAVTAHVWDHIGQAAGQACCDGFLSKPYTAAKLIQLIHKHLKPGGT
jgi:CheY-like chemotaxis protein